MNTIPCPPADWPCAYHAFVHMRPAGRPSGRVFAFKRYSPGDFDMNRTHHGTPDEPAAAVVLGFETAYRERRSFADAIVIGVNYVECL